MSHLHRFYIPPETPITGEVLLPPEEAHHALHVVRLRVGEPVGLFDGCGREWTGTLAHATKREAVVTVHDARQVPPPTRMVLLQAWLKRERAIEAIIQRGTEIGISGFCFFPAERSERKPHGEDKWRRHAIESCKQCGRLWLPTFRTAAGLDAALSDLPGTLLIATMDRPAVELRGAIHESGAALLIGPEGDFTHDELDRALARGAQPISLGAATYRSEVAAVLAATLVLYELGEFGSRTTG